MRLLQRFREVVPWYWRWLLGGFLVIIASYGVEDIRGALAWKRFVDEHPEFDGSMEGPVRHDEESVWEMRILSGPLEDFLDDERFDKILTGRTYDVFFGERTRRLEFPNPPFRRSGPWYPSAIVKESSEQTEIDCALLILRNDKEFVKFGSEGRGATIRRDLSRGKVDDPFEVKLYIRVLIYRALAFLEVNRVEESHHCLLRVIEMIAQFDDGLSITRSNDVAVDLMLGLQLIWQRVLDQQVTATQLKEMQVALQKLDYQRKARKNAIDFAIGKSRQLDRFKWSFSSRKDLAGKWEWHWDYSGHFTGGKELIEFYLNQARLYAYAWAMPNGWVDRNKICICRDALLFETGSHADPLKPDQFLAQRFYFHYPHRFDPRPTEAYIRCAIAALAAERYRFDHDRYPASLPALKALQDPFDPGKPLKYHLDSQGRPVVYSIGPDLKDEDGKPRAPISEGDLVWRYALPEGMTFDDYILY